MSRKIPASEYMGYDKFIKDEPMSVLDKIRAEIEELDGMYAIRDHVFYADAEKNPKYARLWYVRLAEVIDILEKYKAESEGEE